MTIKRSVMSVSVAVVVALLFCLGGPAAKAQDSKMQVFGGYSFQTNNCFALCVTSPDPALHGYALAFAYNFNRHVALEANFSGHNGTPTVFNDTPTTTDTGDTERVNENVYLYTFGPKFSIPVGAFSLYSHVLVGATHTASFITDQCLPATTTGDVETCSSTAQVTEEMLHSNGFAAKVGGGVDWNHKRWGIRILEVDYVHGQVYGTSFCSICQSESEDKSVSAFELASGVTFNFGSMK